MQSLDQECARRESGRILPDGRSIAGQSQAASARVGQIQPGGRNVRGCGGFAEGERLLASEIPPDRWWHAGCWPAASASRSD